MLIQFTLGNFRSFREPMTFSFSAAPLISQDKRVDEDNTFEAGSGGLRLLRAAAIYGANASGKSNLVKGLQLMRALVLRSARLRAKYATEAVEPFALTTDTVEKPSSFEVVIMLDGIETRYGFMATSKRVEAEWLFQRTTSKERRLFVRERDKIQVGKPFPEGAGLEERTRPDALFISVVAEFNGAIASALVAWYRLLLVRTSVSSLMVRGRTVRAIEDGIYGEAIIQLIRELDVGIEDIRIEQDIAQPELFSEVENNRYLDSLRRAPRQSHVLTVHRAFTPEGERSEDVIFDISRQESDGTRKLFALAGMFIEALHMGRVVVLDELDAQLHPHLTQALVRLFTSADTNPGNGQLLFTTHDTHLQNRRWLRRDQIWTAEKNRLGATTLRSIAEYRGLRNDSSYEERYLAGRVGGVPHLGDPAAALTRSFHSASLRARVPSQEVLELDFGEQRPLRQK